MHKYIKLVIIYGLLATFLAGCFGEGKGCIEADDFGWPKVNISPQGYDVKLNYSGYEYSGWQDTGLQIDGSNLIVSINAGDIYSPWGASSYVANYLQLPSCFFYQNDLAGQFPENPYYAYILNPPCNLENGVGLFMLITPPEYKGRINEEDYNTALYPASSSVSELANARVYQLNNQLQNVYHQNNQNQLVPAYGIELSSQELTNLIGGRIYFRVADNYYADNAGGYNLSIMSGAYSATTHIASFFIGFVQSIVSGIEKASFISMVTSSTFAGWVKVSLTLYILITALLHIVGMIQDSASDIAFRSMKIAIVLALLSENSWNFVYDHLFLLIIKGPPILLDIIVGAPIMPSYSNNSTTASGVSGPFYIVDDIAGNVISSEAFLKAISLLFSASSFSYIATILLVMCTRFIFVLILIVALVIFFFIINILVLMYIMAILAISVLIVVSPIMICCLLFEYTRSHYFRPWLSMLVGFSLQPVILLIFFKVSVNLVMTQYQHMLGFRICPTSIIPGVMQVYVPSISNNQANIYVPGYWVNSGGQICEPYQCVDYRYVDLPYLNPNIPSDNQRIQQLLATQDPFNIFDIVLLVIVLLIVYIISMKLGPKIALELSTALGGGQRSGGALSQVAQTSAVYQPHNMVARGAANFVKGRIGKAKSAVRDKINKKIKKGKEDLKKELRERMGINKEDTDVSYNGGSSLSDNNRGGGNTNLEKTTAEKIASTEKRLNSKKKLLEKREAKKKELLSQKDKLSRELSNTKIELYNTKNAIQKQENLLKTEAKATLQGIERIGQKELKKHKEQLNQEEEKFYAREGEYFAESNAKIKEEERKMLAAEDKRIEIEEKIQNIDEEIAKVESRLTTLKNRIQQEEEKLAKWKSTTEEEKVTNLETESQGEEAKLAQLERQIINDEDQQ